MRGRMGRVREGEGREEPREKEEERS